MKKVLIILLCAVSMFFMLRKNPAKETFSVGSTTKKFFKRALAAPETVETKSMNEIAESGYEYIESPNPGVIRVKVDGKMYVALLPELRMYPCHDSANQCVTFPQGFSVVAKEEIFHHFPLNPHRASQPRIHPS